MSRDANDGLLSQESERSFDDSGEDGEDYGASTYDDDRTGDISFGVGGASEVASEALPGVRSSRNTPMGSRRQTMSGPNRFIVASRIARQEGGVLKVEDEIQVEHGRLSSNNRAPEAPITQAEPRKMGHKDIPQDSWRPVCDVPNRPAEHNRSGLGTLTVNGGKDLQVSSVRIVHFSM